VAHVFADFSSKNVFFTEGGIFAAKTVKEPSKQTPFGDFKNDQLIIYFLLSNE
jgi:retron-type reverse transcriptase